MASSRRTLTSRPLAVLALLILVAFVGPPRAKVLFLADFNPVAGDPNGADEFLAKGGKIVVVGPPDVFHVASAGLGEGVLTVGENAFGAPAVLTGKLDQPAQGAQLDVSLEMTSNAGLSDLVVAIVDDDGGEMIDITFDDQDDGLVQVGGQVAAFDPGGADPGSGSFHVEVKFKQHLFGLRSWKVILSGAFGVQQFQGFVPGLGSLNIDKLRVVRPGNSRGGSWVLDDMIVSKPLDESLTNDS